MFQVDQKLHSVWNPRSKQSFFCRLGLAHAIRLCGIFPGQTKFLGFKGMYTNSYWANKAITKRPLVIWAERYRNGHVETVACGSSTQLCFARAIAHWFGGEESKGKNKIGMDSLLSFVSVVFRWYLLAGQLTRDWSLPVSKLQWN